MDPEEMLLPQITGSGDRNIVMLRVGLDKLRQGFCVFDGDQRLMLFNRRYAEMYRIDLAKMHVGMHLREIVELRFAAGTGPDMSGEQYASWRSQIAVDNQVVETLVRLVDGRVIEIYHEPTADGGWVATHDDITERVRSAELLAASEARLRESEERLALALDAGSDGLWDIDAETGRGWFSDRWWRMAGYEPGELEASTNTWRRLLHPDDRKSALRLLRTHLTGRIPVYECEHRLRRKDGSWAWVLTRGKVVSRNSDGRALRFVGTNIDITARKEAENKLAHLALHDALTDLPNRRLFQKRFQERLDEIERFGGACAVLCLDLDRFKEVNDTLGHIAGDALLREIVDRIRCVLRSGDTVARIGGDEFVVLLSEMDRKERALALADQLIAVARAPVCLDGDIVEIGLSIGIATAPKHGTKSDRLLARADLALYRAKADGGNTARFFNSVMDEAVADRRRLERELKGAIGRDELEVHYQPIVKGDGGLLLGFEALVRWHHPERGKISPAAFVPIAEECGLIGTLGEWVLRTACSEAARWSSPLTIAVNLSPKQFQNANLPDLVLEILSQTGLSPSRLELEITESVIINDMVRALAILRRLKGLGVRIAMDDFGTGYSSLATLQAFPFDKIKIDRSFVGQIETSAQAVAIVRAIIGLGRSLGVTVVAEGVESDAQFRFLSGQACDQIQGFLFGGPQPAAAYKAAIASPADFGDHHDRVVGIARSSLG